MNSIKNSIKLNSLVKELASRLFRKKMDEITTTASIDTYQTPYAFGKKINKKYTNLTNNQKSILKEYINSISDDKKFRLFLETKLPSLKKSLSSKVNKVKEKVLRIKLKEAINCIDKFCLNESKTTDKSVVQMLRYYELDKELRKIK